MKILVICTGNTCRSQMAEGFLKSFDDSFEVFSAGTKAEQKVNPFAIKAMAEKGVDISNQKPKSVYDFVKTDFDYLITVCDNAKEICPFFSGNVKHRLHISFEDPANAMGSEEEIMQVYRKVRDEIGEKFFEFYKQIPPEKKKNDLKDFIKKKYDEIATQSKQQDEKSCCDTDCCCDNSYSIFSEDYTKLKGYSLNADLLLGCGLPTEYAGIKERDHVLDLGSGAGNDCFVARAIVGEFGKVTGLDFSDEMIKKAMQNNARLGYKNVKFFKGDIEEMPFHSDLVDVIISNCVINLLPDKEKAFREIYRVLKKRGHFCISDLVLKGELPECIRDNIIMYAGCISGALQKEDYLKIICDCGFENIQLKKEKQIVIPDPILVKYMGNAKLETFRKSGAGVYSITVTAEKPNGLQNNYNFNSDIE